MLKIEIAFHVLSLTMIKRLAEIKADFSSRLLEKFWRFV
jgi:hypothetical protein